jgi:hypothetical protein
MLDSSQIDGMLADFTGFSEGGFTIFGEASNH